MSSVYQRSDGRWVAKFKDLEGSWRYIYRKSKREAREALREAIKVRDEGISPAKSTVREYLEGWLEDQNRVFLRKNPNCQKG